MSPAQRILRAVLPRAWFTELETRTRRWDIACASCDRSKDLWEAGGLRWAEGGDGGPGPQGHCAACDARRDMVIRPKG